MGKEGELWDDSVLINAFDDAMSKYKVLSPSLYTFHFFFLVLFLVINFYFSNFAENAWKEKNPG